MPCARGPRPVKYVAWATQVYNQHTMMRLIWVKVGWYHGNFSLTFELQLTKAGRTGSITVFVLATSVKNWWIAGVFTSDMSSFESPTTLMTTVLCKEWSIGRQSSVVLLISKFLRTNRFGLPHCRIILSQLPRTYHDGFRKILAASSANYGEYDVIAIAAWTCADDPHQCNYLRKRGHDLSNPGGCAN